MAARTFGGGCAAAAVFGLALAAGAASPTAARAEQDHGGGAGEPPDAADGPITGTCRDGGGVARAGPELPGTVAGPGGAPRTTADERGEGGRPSAS